MSEQNQSNFQALGAGLLGFAVVMAVGGGALMVHSSQQSKAAKPAAAAAPIDLGAPVPRFESAPTRPQSERRAESPAPLIGGEEESEGVEAAAPAQSAAASSVSPEAAPTERARLTAVAHVETGGSRSTAEAVVKNTFVEEKEKIAAKSKAPVKKLPVKLPQTAGAEAVASVHYGVTNRSELMGRAAGPVYNVKGGGAVGGSAPKGKMAEDLNAKVADLKKQLDGSGLPPEARDRLLKDLAEAQKVVPNTASAQ